MLKRYNRNWDWWAYFWRVIHRQTLKGIEKWDEEVVRFLIEVLGCQKGERFMRKIDYKDEFDYCIMISGTFGFFCDKENLRLLQKIKKALKPGGRLLFDIRNPKRKQQYGKSWMAINGGYLLIDTKFDIKAKREIGEHIFIDKLGNTNTMSKSINRQGNRLYTLQETKSLLRRVGLKFTNAYRGYFLPPMKTAESLKSSNIVITATK